jgi:hypothetical protein
VGTAHGREGFTGGEARQPWDDDFIDILALRRDSTFLIKVAHWFNW